MKEVIIIGNGIAGITAARQIRKLSDYRITVISAESKHFWSRTALMYIYMGHMTYEHTKPYEDNFWEKNQISLIQDYVKMVNPDDSTITLKSNRDISYDYLILATGSRPNFFGWEGEDLDGVSGMVSLQDLKKIEQYTKGISRGVIIGGGLIGIELAEMLRSRNIDVTFLVREKEFWNNVLPQQEASLISNHIREHHVDLQLQTSLEKILPDDQGRVRAIRTSNGQEISCQFVGITAGVHPNIDLARASGIPADRGILVNEYLETGIPGIFAIGDCAERTNDIPGRKTIEQVWYTGRMMGETVGATITGNKSVYMPGPWFNSAKFFDIEYQTYGNVAPELPEDQSEFFWKDPDGRHAVHLVFENSSGVFLGINSLGIRFRHEMFDQWLEEKVTVRTVMQQIHKANFDPEFFSDYTKDIREAFNQKYPEYKVKIERNKILGFI